MDPKIVDSIQFNIIKELKEGEFDIIYDDDNSGEIADIITIKRNPEEIFIQLYHLKFDKAQTPNQRIDNLYEVCGQALKSTNWVFRDPKEFFEHLMRRETKSKNDKFCSRIEFGSKDDIMLIKEMARRKLPVKLEMFIIQPGLSSINPSNEQLSLLRNASRPAL